jgi:hypothetical protein
LVVVVDGCVVVAALLRFAGGAAADCKLMLLQIDAAAARC